MRITRSCRAYLCEAAHTTARAKQPCLCVAASGVFGLPCRRQAPVRLAMLIERRQDLIRFHRLLQCRGLGVMAVFDVGQIAPQFFEHVDNLGGFLLGQ